MLSNSYTYSIQTLSSIYRLVSNVRVQLARRVSVDSGMTGKSRQAS